MCTLHTYLRKLNVDTCKRYTTTLQKCIISSAKTFDYYLLLFYVHFRYKYFNLFYAKQKLEFSILGIFKSILSLHGTQLRPRSIIWNFIAPERYFTDDHWRQPWVGILFCDIEMVEFFLHCEICYAELTLV